MKITSELENTLAILEFYFDWEWWKSYSTGCRCLFAPNSVPRFPDEWFLERADKTEDFVSDIENILYPDFANDYNESFKLLDKIRKKFNTGFILCDFDYEAEEFHLDLPDLDCPRTFVARSVSRCIFLAAIELMKI